MPRAVIIRNPASRRAPSRVALERACAVLDATWEIEVVDSTRTLGITALARDASLAGIDYVLACGGDGTLNEVLNGVVSASPSETVVGLIPAGTENVWAQEAQVPRDPRGALRLLSEGQVLPVDLGRARAGGIDRHFLLMCSLGFDAATVEAVEQRPWLKRRLAQAAFAVAGVSMLAREQPISLSVDGNPGRMPVAMLLAGNSQLYGGLVRLAPHARLDDGLLDLLVFRVRPGRRRWVDIANHVMGLVGDASARRSRSRSTRRQFEYRQAASFTVTPAAVMAMQCDGEFLGRVGVGVSISIEACPAAVRMLLPRGPNRLFGDPATRGGD